MNTLSIDIETYSFVDLGKSGVYKYAEAADFEILLFSYAVDDEEIKTVDLASGEQIPQDVFNAIYNPKVIKWAFNAQFERVCLSRHLGTWLEPDAWRCTMVWAATLGLPLSLAGVGAVLGLERQKMKEGRTLIRYFSMPCKPTKTNGGRTRNMPEHAPDKWAQFKEYNKRDVEVERDIKEKMKKFPVPDIEWRNFIQDQQINDRGIRLDMTLVKKAIVCDAQFRGTHMKEARRLTGLDNPNSTQQLKEWLISKGMTVDSLGKEDVSELLGNADGDVKRVLQLRQELAKSSVKKYAAMQNAVCKDGRAHGLLQFYGANRTGRWAGRLIQVQNLPQNHLPDLEQVRHLVREGQFDVVDMLYDSVPMVLSELIRTAFIPKNGCRFFVADFAAIEARVIAWLAGERWRQEMFATHGKIYEASASQMFHVPVEEITKGSRLRQMGKVAELACIAEDEMVLTDKGLIPIQDIKIEHKLWDGENWVLHDGVVFKGYREVMSYGGLRATKDHLVWIQGTRRPVRFTHAATGCAHLVQTGNGRKAVWLGENNIFGETVECVLEPLLCPDTVCTLQSNTVDDSRRADLRQIKGVSKLLPAQADTQVVGETDKRSQTTLPESQRQKLPQLRSERNKVQLSECFGSRTLDDGESGERLKGAGDGPHRYERQLREGEYSVRAEEDQSRESETDSIKGVEPKRVALCEDSCNTAAVKRYESRTDNPSSETGGLAKTKKLALYTGAARVYDIRNAGPNHRFTVSGVLVHNCGYGGGVGALKAMGALEMGVQEKEPKKLINTWRSANPNIVKLWWAVDRAAKKAVKERTRTELHRLVFEWKSGILFIRLPSSRRLAYVKPKMGINRFGREGVTYEGVGATKKWERIDSYGAKFVENIVQAIARDLLTDAMRRLNEAGYSIVMHCHDEVVIEASAEASIDEICSIMAQTPEWADGLLLRADGYVCDFYKKD